MDQEVEGDSFLWGTHWLHTRRGGMQEVLGQEAEVLPARVVKGVGSNEACIEEEEGQGGADWGDKEDEPQALGSRAKAGAAGAVLYYAPLEPIGTKRNHLELIRFQADTQFPLGIRSEELNIFFKNSLFVIYYLIH